MCGSTSASAQHQTQPPLGIQDEGGTEVKPVFTLDCVGAGIECTQSGTTGTLTVGGGGSGNSFETITPPAGASVVADSSTDTLTITEDTFLTITGTAATDTIAITQVTTDVGTDGLIAANAVALTTDTTGNYVATVGDCTASEGAACFDGFTDASVLTFLHSAITGDIAFDGTSGQFEFTDDVAIEDATPHLRFTDDTLSEDDFEFYADGNSFYLTNLTDAVQILRVDASNDTTFDSFVFLDTSEDRMRIGRGLPLPTSDLQLADQTGTADFSIWTAGSEEGLIQMYTVGGTLSAPTTVTSNTLINAIEFFGYGVSNNSNMASILVYVDGEPATAGDTSDMPGRFEFLTTPDGSATALERLQIDNAGNIDIGAGAGVRLSQDGDGALTILGQGDGSDENLTLNFDDTADRVVVSSGTGVTAIDFAAIGLEVDTDTLLTLGADTFEFDGTTNDFELSDDLSLTDATPHLQLIDSTASEDDFEWYADASQVYLTNVTDAVELLRWSSTNAFFLRGSGVTYAWPTADGTNGQFLTTNGSGTMTWTTSSGSGDITDVFNCASGDCASIATTDGDLLSFAGVSVSTTTEGLILPQHATDCSTAGTAEGQVCWEADANTLYVGNGATVTQVGAGSDTNADKEFVWPMSALLPLEAADSIPPLAKDASTTFDFLPVDFDQSTDEGRTYTFMVPPDMTAGGTVIFGVVWYAASVTTGNVMWSTTQNGGVADGVDPDVSSTTEAAAADAVAGTAGQITITTWTQTTTNLNWSASDFVTGVIFRDANHASDTLAADSRALAFFIRIPRS